jgi:hypothetical protein
MRHIVICGLLVYTVFLHIMLWLDFRKTKITERTVFGFLFSLQLLSETFLVIRRIERERYV